MVRRRFVEDAADETHIHKITWQVVQRQVTNAEPDILSDLVMMTFCHHTLEGYANFLGAICAPELWQDEKRIFRGAGLSGKLAALHGACGLAEIDEGQRPYSTIGALEQLRNCIAHPRPQQRSGQVEYAEGREPPMFPPSYLERWVSRRNAQQAVEDVQEIVGGLHTAALAAFPAARHRLGPDGLGGIVWSRTTTSHLKPAE